MSRPLILVVDDEPGVVAVVRAYLEREGYRVQTAASGSQALECARREPPQLMVLDVMLPDKGGLDVLRELKPSNIPVIMLSARAEDTDKLLGLELGADDYVTKPFSPRELVARVRAVLRRAAVAADTPKIITCGKLVIDAGRFEARCAAKTLNLTATEFRLLRALAEAPGQVLTRAQLLDRALGDSYEGYERTVDAHIKNIRRKLPAGACRITTVQGVGYKMESANE